MAVTTLTAVLHEEEDLHVAECPKVGTVSQGATVEEATDNLNQATELYLEESSLPSVGRSIWTAFEAAVRELAHAWAAKSSGREAVRVVEALGFVQVRQPGSHVGAQERHLRTPLGRLTRGMNVPAPDRSRASDRQSEALSQEVAESARSQKGLTLSRWGTVRREFERAGELRARIEKVYQQVIEIIGKIISSALGDTQVGTGTVMLSRQTQSERPHLPALTDPVKVLIADDDADARTALYRAFADAEHAFQAFSAPTGTEALLQFGMNRPDVIVLGVGEGKSYCWDFLRRIRELSTVPIIALSDRDEPEIRILSLKLGADYVVSKPQGFPELSARARTLARRDLRGGVSGLGP